MANEKEVLQRFLADVKDHRMEIVKDDGLYRHLRFARPATMNQWFGIVAWPGYLTFFGDMGTYVFSRTRDMFETFRLARAMNAAVLTANGPEVRIDSYYWTKRLQAAEKGGHTEWSERLFREAVKLDFDSYFADEPADDDAKRGCWESIECEVLAAAHDKYDAMRSVMDFSDGQTGFEFVDFYEHELHEYTHHYLWCLYAIAWGVERYDAAKSTDQAATVAV